MKYEVQMCRVIREWSIQTVEAASEDEAKRLAKKAAKADPDCWCDNTIGAARVRRVYPAKTNA